MRRLVTEGQLAHSRNGDVLVMPSPVVSVYEQPTERVLFDPLRNANPFFHLFESLWMLAGRDDAVVLDRYVKDFSKRYADNGIIHGAYGARWRRSFGFDQLEVIVQRLRKDQNDRQCVLQMWDAKPTYEGDGSDDLCGSWKDRPCNTHVYFRVRDVDATEDDGSGDVVSDGRRVLDMTILCRSNDVVWGAYGANAVHFSMLQEYMAGRIGVDVGTMYQVSNNYHGYVEAMSTLGDPDMLSEVDPYEVGSVRSHPIGTDWGAWDSDLHRFMLWHTGGTRNPHGLDKVRASFVNEWFGDVAVPISRANSLRRDGDVEGALSVVAEMRGATDWQAAAREWLIRLGDRS